MRPPSTAHPQPVQSPELADDNRSSTESGSSSVSGMRVHSRRVAQRGAGTAHCLDPPRLAATAAQHHTSRHRQVSLDPGRGHHFRRGAHGGVGDQRGGVLRVSLLRYREGDRGLLLVTHADTTWSRPVMASSGGRPEPTLGSTTLWPSSCGGPS